MPEPEESSREELLTLVAALRAGRDEDRVRIDGLLVQVGGLTAQVQALVLRLGKDSATSSRPPSSDDPGRRPRGGSSRERSGRKAGKQPGAPGAGLSLVEDPGEKIVIPAPVRCACGSPLAQVPVVGVRRRQVHDLAPQPAPVVVEYAAEVKDCPDCHRAAVGEFPQGVNAPAQYGPELTVRVADVVLGHHVPVQRSTELVGELVGVKVSAGFAASLRGRAKDLIVAGGFVDAVKTLLAGAPVVHADETFARARCKITYLHVACTEHLTLMHTGDRSAATIDAGGVLDRLGGVLVRDGYAGYAHLTNVLHAWCGAHLLRDLRGVYEADPDGQLWAKAMADTLLEAHQVATAARDTGRSELTDDELATIDGLYTGALARARADNPADDTAVLAGHARTLARRFDTHRATILRFTTNLDVGFTNNVAERAVRPAKVQQRSSGGCWRTLEGLADFAVVQSYLSTAAHWGITRFEALHRLFTTGPWIPPGLSPTAIAA